MKTLFILALLLLISTPVWAQGPVINQSTCSMSWDAPQTNADGTNLTDLAGYRVYVAPSLTALAALTTPTFTVPAGAGDPPAGATGTTPCKTLANGAWVVAVTAFDTSTPPNESARSTPFPFVLRDDVSPSVPSNVRMP
jgi:hypothetical protein